MFSQPVTILSKPQFPSWTSGPVTVKSGWGFHSFESLATGFLGKKCLWGCQQQQQQASYLGFPRWLSGKNPSANAGEADSIPESGRSPGGGNDNPLQYYCLENPMDRGAWRATVRGAEWLSAHAGFIITGGRSRPAMQMGLIFCVCIKNFWKWSQT